VFQVSGNISAAKTLFQFMKASENSDELFGNFAYTALFILCGDVQDFVFGVEVQEHFRKNQELLDSFGHVDFEGVWRRRAAEVRMVGKWEGVDNAWRFFQEMRKDGWDGGRKRGRTEGEETSGENLDWLREVEGGFKSLWWEEEEGEEASLQVGGRREEEGEAWEEEMVWNTLFGLCLDPPSSTEAGEMLTELLKEFSGDCFRIPDSTYGIILAVCRRTRDSLLGMRIHEILKERRGGIGREEREEENVQKARKKFLRIFPAILRMYVKCSGPEYALEKFYEEISETNDPQFSAKFIPATWEIIISAIAETLPVKAIQIFREMTEISEFLEPTRFTWIQIFGACAELEDSEAARFLESKFGSTIFSKSEDSRIQISRMYMIGKCFGVSDSLSFFEYFYHVFSDDISAWNTLLRICREKRNPETATKVLSALKKNPELIPNHFTFSHLFWVFGVSSNSEIKDTLLSYFRDSGGESMTETNPGLLHGLVFFLTKINCGAEAIDIFLRIKKPDTPKVIAKTLPETWEILFHVCKTKNLMKEAKRLWTSAMEEVEGQVREEREKGEGGFTKKSYLSLLALCGCHEDSEFGKKIHRHLSSIPFPSLSLSPSFSPSSSPPSILADDEVFTSVVLMYANCLGFTELLKRLPFLVRSRARGDSGWGKEEAGDLEQEGSEIPMDTWFALFRFCKDGGRNEEWERGEESDERERGRGSMEDAFAILGAMDEAGVIPIPEIYVLLMKICEGSKIFADAKKIHAHILNHEISGKEYATFSFCHSLPFLPPVPPACQLLT
jgi:hypothetical protein